MNIDLSGKKVLITAAASGLGLATAQVFADCGATLAICDIDARALGAAQVQLPGLSVVIADVGDVKQANQMVADALEKLGGIDFLINNAGIAGPTGPVETLSPKAWDQTLQVNISGQFYCTRAVVPSLKAQRSGGIVNVSSTAGMFGYPLRTPYAASKWAVVGFTKSLAMELGEYNVRANAVCPGSLEGPRMQRVIANEAQSRGTSPQAIRDGYERAVSMRTFISPQEVAYSIAYLCSDAARHVSGQVLAIDGNTETLKA